jgi:outer membrane lipoprotein-sorting protein
LAVSRAALAALALLLMGTTFPDAPDGVDEITDCIKANQPKLSTEQEVSFRVVDRLGSARVSNAKIYWQKTRGQTNALVRFTAPSDLRGSALLLIEKGDRSDMFMYLPELRKVRRISDRTVAGSMFGTDFSYEDFERLQGLTEDGDTRRLPDGEVEGRATFVLEGRPARGEDSAYERVVSYVDQEHCVPLRTELYEQSDRPRKVMVAPFEKVSQHDSLWVPRLVQVRDLLDETQTELILDEVEFDKKLPRKLFSERELVAGAR